MPSTIGSLPTNAFAGYPTANFHVSERRSTTVHIIDAGYFDVLAHDTGSGVPVWAGRYKTYD